MTLTLPTAAEIGSALAHLGNWRVLHVQEACYPYTPVPASVMLGIGYRETSLRNVCGGAKWDGEKWVQSYTDRGWLQIAATISSEAAWLAKQEGCPNGSWVPLPPGHNALEEMHVPRFSPALDFVKATMIADMAYAAKNGVPKDQVLRFAIAAHNAGAGGALKGFKEGNVDRYTAHGDYSAYVISLQPLIHDWIVAHPNWVYRPA